MTELTVRDNKLGVLAEAEHSHARRGSECAWDSEEEEAQGLECRSRVTVSPVVLK